MSIPPYRHDSVAIIVARILTSTISPGNFKSWIRPGRVGGKNPVRSARQCAPLAGEQVQDHQCRFRWCPIGSMRESQCLSYREASYLDYWDLRFMCTFRFKMWWMTQRMGSFGRDIPFETQFLIVEGTDGSHFGEGSEDGMGRTVVYTVFLPILEGAFRAVLQGNANDELEICLESGAPAVEVFEGSHLVLVASGSDPFEVIRGQSSVAGMEHYGSKMQYSVSSPGVQSNENCAATSPEADNAAVDEGAHILFSVVVAPHATSTMNVTASRAAPTSQLLPLSPQPTALSIGADATSRRGEDAAVITNNSPHQQHTPTSQGCARWERGYYCHHRGSLDRLRRSPNRLHRLLVSAIALLPLVFVISTQLPSRSPTFVGHDSPYPSGQI
ncbi:hypothetical protein ZIOFF_042007 [Zingiber officinale]|uniref:Uncharacterized protein n=1 Tax=Zingiber officinale TaxID=94328 RepID=A0A8J5KWM7_ZINOF|nr:hypothetical protein ZIOFF_042007 [Zingiber officinale]